MIFGNARERQGSQVAVHLAPVPMVLTNWLGELDPGKSHKPTSEKPPTFPSMTIDIGTQYFEARTGAGRDGGLELASQAGHLLTTDLIGGLRILLQNAPTGSALARCRREVLRDVDNPGWSILVLEIVAH